MVVLFLVSGLVASGLVPPSECEEVAYKVAGTYWETAKLVSVLRFDDCAGVQNAYAYVYTLSEKEFDPARYYDEHDEFWGLDRYATVIVATNYSNQPILEISNTLPAFIANRSRALECARALWGNAELSGYIYLAPLDEFFKFTTEQGVRYLHAFELKEYDLKKLTPVFLSEESSVFVSTNEHQGWQSILKAGLEIIQSNKVEGVPAAIWSYGCTPTAASMIMDYWDRNGYPKLVDYYFDRWDITEGRTDYDLTNVHQELAVAMHTDSLGTGSTSTNRIASGFRTVANSINGYSFSSSLTGTTSNSYNFGVIVSEIDAGRPAHWSVGNYQHEDRVIDHSTCAIGYLKTTTDDFVIVRNTWDRGEHLWPIQSGASYCNLCTIIPGGAQGFDLRLTNLTGTNEIYSDLAYPLSWSPKGEIAGINVLRSTNDKGTGWELFETADSSNNYILFESAAELEGSRFKIEAHSTDGLVAADGTPGKISLRTFLDQDHFDLVGHVPASIFPFGKMAVKDNYAYVVQGPRLCSIELAKDYLLPIETFAPFPAFDLTTSGDWLYVLGEEALYLYDVSSPAAVSFSDSLLIPMPYQSIVAVEPYVYLGSVDADMVVLKRVGSQLVEQATISGAKVNVFRIIDGKLYAGSSAPELRIYDLNDPSSPQLDATIPLLDPAAGVARQDSFLFVAEGVRGFEIIDLFTWNSDRIIPETINELETSNGRLFAAGKYGRLLVYDIDGTLDLPLAAKLSIPEAIIEGMALTDRIYLSAGPQGFYSFTCDLTGIEEEKPEPNRIQLNIKSLQRTGSILGNIELLRPGKVELSCFSVTGRKVMKFVREYESGIFDLPGLPDNLPSGVYFLEVKQNNQSLKAKVIVLR
ncbi:T9SS type A sorting domain-containing protein [candidate division WOR-3 bacterium]|nr:T9SS type A sorting domain-containing protein [candidate division WOR-3 bacterium]